MTTPTFAYFRIESVKQDDNISTLSANLSSLTSTMAGLQAHVDSMASRLSALNELGVILADANVGALEIQNYSYTGIPQDCANP